MTREELIQRKVEVQAEIHRLRRQAEALRLRPGGRDQHRLAEVEAELSARMAEESRLRRLIDQSR